MSHENVLVFRKNGKQELLNGFPPAHRTPLWTYAIKGIDWYWVVETKRNMSIYQEWTVISKNFVPKEYKMMALILPRV